MTLKKQRMSNTMPKCLDCGNDTKFWYVEVSHKLGIYDSKGELEDVEDDYYDDVETSSGSCGKCESKNIEGKL
jgi:hypothetical protein